MAFSVGLSYQDYLASTGADYGYIKPGSFQQGNMVKLDFSGQSAAPAERTSFSSEQLYGFTFALGTLADAYSAHVINAANADIASMQAQGIRDIALIQANSTKEIADIQAGLTQVLAETQAQSVRVAAEAARSGALAQAQVQRMIAGANAKIALMGAERARELGQQQKARVLQATEKAVGDARVKAAAAGIRVDYGSSSDIQAETRLVGDIDATTIEVNTAREVWGYKTAANKATAAGEMAATESMYKASLAQIQGNMLPSMIRQQGSMEASILSNLGQSQARVTILGGNLQAMDADTVARMYAQRAIAGPLSTIIAGAADYYGSRVSISATT